LQNLVVRLTTSAATSTDPSTTPSALESEAIA
jgi:hypothetical protein